MYCKKLYFFVFQVVLKKKVIKVDCFNCKLTTFARYIDVSQRIMKYLNVVEVDVMVSRTQFGNLIVSANRYKLSDILLWYIISRQTFNSPNINFGFWMVIRKKFVRVSILEFCLITDLNCSRDIPEIAVTLEFKSKHFGDMDVVYV